VRAGLFSKTYDNESLLGSAYLSQNSLWGENTQSLFSTGAGGYTNAPLENRFNHPHSKKASQIGKLFDAVLGAA
jgi:hypothetical protein